MNRIRNVMILGRCFWKYLWSILLFFLVSEVKNISAQKECQSVSLSICNRTVNATSFPNIYGHDSEEKVYEVISPFIDPLSTSCPLFTYFLCSVYLPLCPGNGQGGVQELTLPCRSQCETAYSECNGVLDQNEMTWPTELDCTSFPTVKCYIINGKWTNTNNV